MEVVKRKILLEESIDRSFNSPTWGAIVASDFYINVLLTQNIDDMGLFTDISFISGSTSSQDQPDYTILINKLSASGITFPFMTSAPPPVLTGLTGTASLDLRIPGKPVSLYYNYGGLTITGNTDSKIEDLRSYNASNPFQIGFDMVNSSYFYYNGVGVSGHSRILSMSEPKIYVFDTLIDGNEGTLNQVYGIAYTEYTGQTRIVTINGSNVIIPLTTFNYKGQGWNDTDMSLSALTKEEYLFGIISPPEVQSDVFIDRGITTVMDKHLRLSEIKNLGQLSRYGNGFYNLTT